MCFLWNFLLCNKVYDSVTYWYKHVTDFINASIKLLKIEIKDANNEHIWDIAEHTGLIHTSLCGKDKAYLLHVPLSKLSKLYICVLLNNQVPQVQFQTSKCKNMWNDLFCQWSDRIGIVLVNWNFIETCYRKYKHHFSCRKPVNYHELDSSCLWLFPTRHI